jgi:pyridinium-3,5-biscarboxylic acid mononucleotide synthase
MNEDKLQDLLARVAAGALPIHEALDKLRSLPFTEATDALLDTHRALRTGMPEVVYARGKTPVQVIEALGKLQEAHGHALATAVSPEMAGIVQASHPHGHYDPVSRLFRIGQMPAQASSIVTGVACAGTSDLPVAEEAAQTLEFAGFQVERFTDVGVAGLHRLLSKLEALRKCHVIIVIAGMEGALPGVLSGLVSAPVIAVPTSVGYGAGLSGFSALLTMLNSCSSGLGVVNIDNGFGAAMLAIRILSLKNENCLL